MKWNSHGVHTALRMSPVLRDKLEKSARANDRSLSKEMEQRLEASFLLDALVNLGLNLGQKGGTGLGGDTP